MGKSTFFLPFIQTVPFIKMVAVCNTLGYDNAAKDSDIDLFIIAKRGRLFIVRFYFYCFRSWSPPAREKSCRPLLSELLY